MLLRKSYILLSLFFLPNFTLPRGQVIITSVCESEAHCLETKLNHKKMGTLQFYIPGFQNNPSYPKQKEFLKFTEGNLK